MVQEENARRRDVLLLDLISASHEIEWFRSVQTFSTYRGPERGWSTCPGDAWLRESIKRPVARPQTFPFSLNRCRVNRLLLCHHHVDPGCLQLRPPRLPRRFVLVIVVSSTVHCKCGLRLALKEMRSRTSTFLVLQRTSETQDAG